MPMPTTQAIPADDFGANGRNRDKVYRDRAPVTALEDFIEQSVRGLSCFCQNSFSYCRFPI